VAGTEYNAGGRVVFVVGMYATFSALLKKRKGFAAFGLFPAKSHASPLRSGTAVVEKTEVPF
jgi:hypothetical protein